MKKTLFTLGLILYATTFVYNSFMSIPRRFGPLDVMVSVTGILLMVPLALSLCERSRMRFMYLFAGIMLISISLHDLIGLHTSQSIKFRLMDVTVWLTGILLIIPYLSSLGGIYREEK